MRRTVRDALCLSLCLCLALPGCASVRAGASSPGDPALLLQPGNRVVVRTHDGESFEMVVKRVDGDCVDTAARECAVHLGDIAEVRKAGPDTGKTITAVTVVLVLVAIAAGAFLLSELESGMSNGLVE